MTYRLNNGTNKDWALKAGASEKSLMYISGDELFNGPEKTQKNKQNKQK